MKCEYCFKEMPLPARHEPNCFLNPFFQNRYYQLPREYLMELAEQNYEANKKMNGNEN